MVKVLGYYVEADAVKRKVGFRDVFVLLEEQTGFSLADGHVNVGKGYVDTCEKISKEEYLSITKGYNVPKEYI